MQKLTPLKKSESKKRREAAKTLYVTYENINGGAPLTDVQDMLWGTIEHIRQNHIESFYIIYCSNKKIWIFDIRIVHFKSKSDFFHKIQFEDNSSMWAKKEKFYKNW